MGIWELPEGYSEIKRVNLQKDVKLAVLINAAAFAIMVALYRIGTAFVPFVLTIRGGNIVPFLLSVGGVLLAIGLYMLAHELVHGVFIKKYSGKKAIYGFTGLYAFAGSEAYFNKRQYITIALAPVILFGLIFFLLNVFLPESWFWAVYFLQIINLSGAAGDYYIAGLMCTLPRDVLSTDFGVEMALYSRT